MVALYNTRYHRVTFLSLVYHLGSAHVKWIRFITVRVWILSEICNYLQLELQVFSEFIDVIYIICNFSITIT